MDELEQIRLLKARYCRFLDTRDIGVLAATVRARRGGPARPRGVHRWRRPADHAAAGRLSRAFEPVVLGGIAGAATMHHCHTPEIELTSPTTATGIWAMEDLLVFPDGSELHGAGALPRDLREARQPLADNPIAPHADAAAIHQGAGGTSERPDFRRRRHRRRFSGLYMLHRLREMGLSAVALEAAERISAAPGCSTVTRAPVATSRALSIPTSSDEIQQEWVWTETMPAQPEIGAYLHFVADKLDLRRDIRLAPGGRDDVLRQRRRRGMGSTPAPGDGSSRRSWWPRRESCRCRWNRTFPASTTSTVRSCSPGKFGPRPATT